MIRRIALLFALALPAVAQDWGDRDVETDADRVPRTKTGGNALVRGATILTLAKAGTIENGSILIRDGKIAEVGRDLRAPEGFAVIDATGLFVMPGIIDCHSHIGGEGGLNEGTRSITSEVRIGDTLAWEAQGAPLRIDDADALRLAVRNVAIAALLLRVDPMAPLRLRSARGGGET